MRLAAIDLGTVTSRLMIADVDNEGIHEVERKARITHLGEGLSESGTISDAAIAREIVACEEFLAAIDASRARDGIPVEQTVAVATSAMRDAANREDVRAALREIGLDVTVIAGEREAQLSFLGTLSGFGTQGDARLGGVTTETSPVTPPSVLTVDVGGGSTEVILGSLASSDCAPRIMREHSFDIGSSRLTERFLPSDPPSAAELSSARSLVRDEMRTYFDGFEARPTSMIAVAGTATTAVTVREAMVDYDPRKVHGSVIYADELANILDKLANKKLDERVNCVGLEPGRAPVIVGGLLILQTVLELAALEKFVVSETDILQGILLDTFKRRRCPRSL